MNWLISRLKEKSTWLALFTFASLFGMQIEPEMKDKLIEAIIAVAAVLAFVFKEKSDDLPANDSQTPKPELPPIELQARLDRRLADSDADLVSGRCVVAVAGDGDSGAADRMQSPVSSERQPESFGFNDR